MSKRALAAVLWFAAAWVGYEIVSSVTELPRLLGPVVAFGVAALVTLDPFGTFWSRTRAAVSRPGSIEAEQTLA